MILSRFLIVGFFGTITNLTTFYIFVDIIGFKPIPISIFAFTLSSFQNYFFNHEWAFVSKTKYFNKSFLSYSKFLFVALISLSINILILSLILNSFEIELKVFAQACGIATGTLFNFLGSKYWVFNFNE